MRYFADAPAPTPSWAAIITAITGLVIAFGGLVTIMVAGVKVVAPLMRRTARTEAAVVAVGTAVADVHVIVNQQRTDAQNYQAALIRALRDAHIDVPIDQAAGPVPSPTAPGGTP